MPSIPQLQSDINKLQAENRDLKAKVKELEDRGQRVVYREKRIRAKGPVQYVDNPEHIKQIEKLRAMLNAGH